jgi:hypothetical protein
VSALRTKEDLMSDLQAIDEIRYLDTTPLAGSPPQAAARAS